MSLLSLPDDLLIDILSSMIQSRDPRKNVLKYRLVCHRLDTITTAAILHMAKLSARSECIRVPFQRVTVRPCSNSLGLLLDTAEHPHLRHIVETIRVRLKPLDLVEIEESDWKDQDYRGLIHLNLLMTCSQPKPGVDWGRLHSICPPRSYLPFSLLAQMSHFPGLYELYHENLRVQKDVFADESLPDKLCTALRQDKYTRLKKVTLAERKVHCQVIGEFKSEKGQLEGDLSEKIKRLTPISDVHYTLWHLMTRALSQRKDIQELHMLDVNTNILDHSKMPDSVLATPDFLQFVQNLTLQVDSRNGGDLKYYYRNWIALLQSCVNVKTLAISHVPLCGFMDRGILSPMSWLVDLHLPRLVEFRLAHLYMDAADLQCFLLRHKTTLRELRLDRVRPFPLFSRHRYWKDMLKTVRAELDLTTAVLWLYEKDLQSIIQDDEMKQIVSQWLGPWILWQPLCDDDGEALWWCHCYGKRFVSRCPRDLGAYLIRGHEPLS